MAQEMCFDCLHRRIQSDFSEKLVFVYGLSDSAFPFGSTAVVQLCNSSGETASAPQFLLSYLPSHEQDCFTKYV
ncbi:protein GFS12 [Prunus yedoensis var. nudiflora]|uniref:Protein GFS12 n=1 Tax=Prunus yedoensis var. nudiflora TaxID=2094558 RepID=A0A314Y6I7_PRUYE|nr:protein GFS12 [Prunus yedoensis var. nudiflora]